METERETQREREFPTFKVKVCEQRNVVSTLFTLGERRENQEASPALAFFSHASTLDSSGEGIQIALGDTI
jgi:hypothetical protein